MERVDLVFKSVVGVIGGFISWMVGGLGLAFVILLGMMALDFIVGLMVGWVTKTISSKIGTKGFFKKIYIIILIGAVYMIDLMVIKTNGVVADGVTIAYIVIEFISLVESGGKLGVPLGPIEKVIQTLKPKKEEVK